MAKKNESAVISDFGEHIGGARKEFYSFIKKNPVINSEILDKFFAVASELVSADSVLLTVDEAKALFRLSASWKVPTDSEFLELYKNGAAREKLYFVYLLTRYCIRPSLTDVDYYLPVDLLLKPAEYMERFRDFTSQYVRIMCALKDYFLGEALYDSRINFTYAKVLEIIKGVQSDFKLRLYINNMFSKYFCKEYLDTKSVELFAAYNNFPDNIPDKFHSGLYLVSTNRLAMVCALYRTPVMSLYPLDFVRALKPYLNNEVTFEEFRSSLNIGVGVSSRSYFFNYTYPDSSALVQDSENDYEEFFTYFRVWDTLHCEFLKCLSEAEQQSKSKKSEYSTMTEEEILKLPSSQERSLARKAVKEAKLADLNGFFKQALARPALVNVGRTGPVFRNRSIVEDDFVQLFGFRGGEFGNCQNQKDRQALLNYFFDSCIDLAYVCDLPVSMIGFRDVPDQQNLAIAFASRGVPNAAAHFEPYRFVVNLTKKSGAGCFSHEWGHVLDEVLFRYLFGTGSKEKGPITHIIQGLTSYDDMASMTKPPYFSCLACAFIRHMGYSIWDTTSYKDVFIEDYSKYKEDKDFLSKLCLCVRIWNMYVSIVYKQSSFINTSNREEIFESNFFKPARTYILNKRDESYMSKYREIIGYVLDQYNLELLMPAEYSAATVTLFEASRKDVANYYNSLSRTAKVKAEYGFIPTEKFAFTFETFVTKRLPYVSGYLSMNVNTDGFKVDGIDNPVYLFPATEDCDFIFDNILAMIAQFRSCLNLSAGFEMPDYPALLSVKSEDFVAGTDKYREEYATIRDVSHKSLKGLTKDSIKSETKSADIVNADTVPDIVSEQNEIAVSGVSSAVSKEACEEESVSNESVEFANAKTKKEALAPVDLNTAFGEGYSANVEKLTKYLKEVDYFKSDTDQTIVSFLMRMNNSLIDFKKDVHRISCKSVVFRNDMAYSAISAKIISKVCAVSGAKPAQLAIDSKQFGPHTVIAFVFGNQAFIFAESDCIDMFEKVQKDFVEKKKAKKVS